MHKEFLLINFKVILLTVFLDLIFFFNAKLEYKICSTKAKNATRISEKNY